MNKKSFSVVVYSICIIILFVMSFTGCKPTKTRTEIAPMATSTPVPHFEKIVFTNNGNLYWMDQDGASREELFPDSNSKWFPAVSKDGLFIAYWVQNKKNYNLWIGDLKKRKAYPVTFDEDLLDNATQNFNFKNSVSFTPDSNYIVFGRRGEIWQMTRDGYDLIALTDTHNCISPAISINDKLVYVIMESENTYNLYMKERNALQPEKLTSLMGKKAGSPSFSPDGKKVVYTVLDGDSNNIFIVDIVSKLELALTTDGKSNSPSFSPDGKVVVYSSSRNDKYMPSIWLLTTASNEMKPISAEGGTSPVWLYQVLAAPMATYTPTVGVNTAIKQDKVFDVKETTAPAATAGTVPVSASAPEAIYAPKDSGAGDVAPFNPEALKVKTIQQGDKLLFYPVIHYDSALSNIKPEFRTALDDMAVILKQNNSPILIEGHTDNEPIKTKKFKSNFELSVARAEAVKTYLIQIHGIESSRISIAGYADAKPLVPNDSNENKYRNRRAEVMVIKVVTDAVAPVSVSPAVKSPVVLATAIATAVVLPPAPPIKVQTKGKSKKSIGW